MQAKKDALYSTAISRGEVLQERQQQHECHQKYSSRTSRLYNLLFSRVYPSSAKESVHVFTSTCAIPRRIKDGWGEKTVQLAFEQKIRERCASVKCASVKCATVRSLSFGLCCKCALFFSFFKDHCAELNVNAYTHKHSYKHSIYVFYKQAEYLCKLINVINIYTY